MSTAPHVLVDSADRQQLELIAELALASGELGLERLVELSLERACIACGAAAGTFESAAAQPFGAVSRHYPPIGSPRAAEVPPRETLRVLEVPVCAGHSVRAEMTLYFERQHEPNANVCEMLDAVGRVLARAIEREQAKRRERALDDEERVEGKQRAIRRRLLTILESITDGFFALDERWTFSYVNRAAERMFGRSRNQLIGHSIWQMVSQRVSDQLRAALESAVEQGHVGELVLCDDADRWLHLRIFPIDPRDVPDDASEYLVSVYARDITDQRRYERDLARSNEALRHRNAELDQFAYIASHDLKAPLRGIGNLASWISEDLGDDVSEATHNDLELLRGRVQRMENMIDALLAFSRAGRESEEPEEIDVQQLVREIVDLLGADDVDWTICETPLTLTTERLPLTQVLHNLASNAVKHVDVDDKRVEIGWTLEGDSACFFVRDNGEGIDPRYHDRIFQMFKTLKPRDKVEGTGIGLALVRKLVESRGGRVWVESREGEGATFRFSWRTNNDKAWEQQ